MLTQTRLSYLRQIATVPRYHYILVTMTAVMVPGEFMGNVLPCNTRKGSTSSQRSVKWVCSPDVTPWPDSARQVRWSKFHWISQLQAEGNIPTNYILLKQTNYIIHQARVTSLKPSQHTHCWIHPTAPTSYNCGPFPPGRTSLAANILTNVTE